MRLHRLELTGFGPFRETQVVDFDAFSGDGIFLISGRTGAGKSSVLDGVCFALYGGVPRYEGGDRRLRSDHCAPGDPTQVVLEFSAAGTRWRVTRSPEYLRPKQRGSGMTPEPHQALLEERIGDDWIGRAARPVDVGRELDEILGLNQQQFLQVILLAQGRFAQFLLAGSDERQKLLRRLFGTRTYEDYQARLDLRRRESERAAARAVDTIGVLFAEAERVMADAGILGGAGAADVGDNVAEHTVSEPEPEPAADDLAGRRARLDRGRDRAHYRAETQSRLRDEAELAARAAEDRFRAATSLRARQEQRQESRARLASLEGVESDIAAARRESEMAILAEALRSVLDAAASAEADERATAQSVSVARTRISAQDGADLTSDALTSLIDRLTGESAVWATAAASEEVVRQLARERDDDAAVLAQHDQTMTVLTESLTLSAERLADLEPELTAARVGAARLDQARADVAAWDTRITCARDAQRLAATLNDTEAAFLSVSAAHDTARAHVTALLRRRLAGHAGELAAALVEGEPCAVCGATAHPHPAEASAPAVTDDEVVRAEHDRDQAAVAESAVGDELRSLREAHAVALAQSGGVGVESLEASRAEAADVVADSEAATGRRDALIAEREQLTSTMVDAERDREAARVAAATLRERLAATEAQTAQAQRLVDEARGEFDSVAARIDDAQQRRRAAADLLSALAAHAESTRGRDRAVAIADDRLAESGFADASTARAALRAPEARATLTSRITAHDVAIRTEKDRLRELELELAGEPEELIDIVLAQAALDEAGNARIAAVDAAIAAAQVAARLDDLHARVIADIDAIAVEASDLAVVARLADTVAGRAPNRHRMTLEAFVLAAELEEIVAAANLRLDDMSAGRYRLAHSDSLAARGAASGLGLEIFDAHTGLARPASSLSGGETFLASLALALGLAEVVTARAGGVRLDTLFVDEGFGSLDDETLDIAMRTLDELRQGGRTVGLISHVAAMKEQIPAQLVVRATSGGPSVIAQSALV